MKKLITFGTICLVACVLFSSCSSKLSITKRHYNKGYYVEHTGKTPAFVKQQSVATTKTPSFNQQTLVSQTNKVESIQTPVADKAFNITSNTRYASAQTRSVQNINAPAAVTEIPAPLITSSITAVTNVKDGERRATLSLFWLVILIIVILWAFGFGFGVGVFINILLVVALILLILWLLRIV